MHAHRTSSWQLCRASAARKGTHCVPSCARFDRIWALLLVSRWRSLNHSQCRESQWSARHDVAPCMKTRGYA
eukprot:1147460-Pelagomonas_calceolata.AAC.2